MVRTGPRGRPLFCAIWRLVLVKAGEEIVRAANVGKVFCTENPIVVIELGSFSEDANRSVSAGVNLVVATILF